MTLAYALAYIALTVVLPYLVLIYAAFITQWGAPADPRQSHPRQCRRDLRSRAPVRQGLVNSLMLAVTGATVAGAADAASSAT